MSAVLSRREMANAVADRLNPPPLGACIDKLNQLREKKRVLEAQVKEIEDQYNALAEQVMERLDADGMDKATGKQASVSISKSLVGNVVDWDKVHAYIKKTGYFHLLQKRLNDASAREIFESGKKIPGCDPFEKKRLNLRSL